MLQTGQNGQIKMGKSENY